jgi:hypothetical protein
MNFKQGTLSLREYYESFEELKEAVIFGNGGGLADHPNLLRHIEANEPDDLHRLYPGVRPRMPSIPPEGATEADLLESIEEMVEYRNDYRDYERELEKYKNVLSDSATEAYLGALFIMNANRTHYEGVIEDLHNEFLVGRVKWPVNLHAAYRQLEGFRKQERKGNNNNQRRKGNDDNRQSDGGSQISFVQFAATPGTDGRLFASITCNKCGDKGHYADRCPSPSHAILCERGTLVSTLSSALAK